MLPTIILLFSFFLQFSLVSATIIQYCERTQSENLEVCVQCKRGYVLDSTGLLCIEAQLKFANCIQISILDECMRCDCGFSLKIENSNNSCVITPQEILGCAVFGGNSNCIRPKEDFILFKESGQTISIRFGRGSHCEILNVAEGKCLQCHSGFKLDRNSLTCRRNSHRIINEYLSYFSEDGELHTRSVLLIATKYGVYPQISSCIQQSSLEGMEKSYCLQCELGKILSSDRTKCLKPPFKSCGKVADFDVNICEECLDNQHFYLDTTNNQQPECLPREYQFDPTERCLQYKKDSPKCHKCAIGLVQTYQGCRIDKEEPHREQYNFNAENNDLRSLEIQGEFQENLRNCEYFLTYHKCASCRTGMIMDDSGNCQEQTDVNCMISNSKGGCFQCFSLMYFSEQLQKCIFIFESWNCEASSGLSNYCETCMVNYFFSEESKKCELIFFLKCRLSLRNQRECELCENLYFLKDKTTCEKISEFRECFLSDGLVDKCSICNKNSQKNDLTGRCVLKVDLVDGACTDRSFYRIDNKMDGLCAPYQFENWEWCFEFNPNLNECLECNSGLYLSSGQCIFIPFCESSNGIHQWCYKGNLLNSYINELGEVKINLNTNCTVNGVFIICTGDQLVSSTERNELEMRIENIYYYSLAANFPSSPSCHYFHYQDDSYVCGLCKSLFYPDSEGICKPITDQNCETSNGKINNCVLCKKRYMLREESSGLFACKLARILSIPYCLNIQGSECLLCQNLYFLRNNMHCEAIYYPNCVSSNGIDNYCLRSQENNESSSKNILLELQNQLEEIKAESCQDSVSQVDSSYCSKCSVGYSKRIKDNNKSEHGIIHICLRQTILHCEIQALSSIFCFKCASGYFPNSSQFQNQVERCDRISIPNCLHVTKNGRKCIECERGYDLLKSGRCFQVHNCLVFENYQCLKCKDSYYLKDGICLQIRDCVKQIHQSCVLCSQGFWIRKSNQGSTKIMDESEKSDEKYGKFQKKSRKIQEESDECIHIPNCALSDGIRNFCLECDGGFQLNQTICVRLNTSDQNCRRFTTGDNECNRCRNLYYLKEKLCLKMNISNCSTSNGISNICTQCSFRGFMLSDSGDCELIPHCQLSNGLDFCILCEDSYIPNIQGKCKKISISIPNCQRYSYQKVNLSYNLPQVIEDKETDRLIDLEQYTSILKNDVEKKTEVEELGCIKCENPYQTQSQKYMQASFQECLPVSMKDLKNCLVFDSLTGFCFYCQTGFAPQLILTKKNFSSACVQTKQTKRLENQGCAIFSQSNDCLLCFEGFFKHSDRLCYPRKNVFKCQNFHPKKDMCLYCRSGYRLKTIREGGDSKSICMILEAHEEVNGCVEYSPNTNKCVKCQKTSKIVEYLLNETLNICEDVMHLMCREIIGVQSNGLSSNTSFCNGGYISFCEEYRDQQLGGQVIAKAECVRCANKYYLGSERDHCHQHAQIENCLVFSQISQDTCEICQPLYFLFQKDQCHAISDKHCKVSEGLRDTCRECLEGFAVDQEREACIKSDIINCLRVIASQDIAICLACKYNYRIAPHGRQCLLHLFDHNCLKTNEEDKCLECKEGYLLNIHGDCINLQDQTCQISNCLEFSSESQAEDIKCSKCFSNFYLNSSQKCQPFDPDSDHIEERKDLGIVPPGSIQEKETPNTQGEDSLIDKYLVCLIIIFFFLALWAIIAIWKLRSKRKARRQELNEEETENNHQNSISSFNKIQMQSYTRQDQADYFNNEI